MPNINNFDVLKKMSLDSLRIYLGVDILELKKVSQGTKITIGIDGNHVTSVFTGQEVARLILYNQGDFDLVKSEMELEAATLKNQPAPDVWRLEVDRKPPIKKEVIGLTIHAELVIVFFDGERWMAADLERQYCIRAWSEAPALPPRND